MSPQQKASSGGGSRKSGKGAGQKDSSTVAAAEQSNNNQTSTTNKKHNNVSSNVNNTNIDQSKTEKEKPHIKVSYSYLQKKKNSSLLLATCSLLYVRTYECNTIAIMMMIAWCFSFYLFTYGSYKNNMKNIHLISIIFFLISIFLLSLTFSFFFSFFPHFISLQRHLQLKKKLENGHIKTNNN